VTEEVKMTEKSVHKTDESDAKEYQNRIEKFVAETLYAEKIIPHLITLSSSIYSITGRKWLKRMVKIPIFGLVIAVIPSTGVEPKPNGPITHLIELSYYTLIPSLFLYGIGSIDMYGTRIANDLASTGYARYEMTKPKASILMGGVLLAYMLLGLQANADIPLWVSYPIIVAAASVYLSLCLPIAIDQVIKNKHPESYEEFVYESVSSYNSNSAKKYVFESTESHREFASKKVTAYQQSIEPGTDQSDQRNKTGDLND
jgi:hypothetical protein